MATSRPRYRALAPLGLRVKQLVLVIGAVYFAFFLAYPSEGPFRELLAISLLMPVVITVVPDDAGLPASGGG